MTKKKKRTQWFKKVRGSYLPVSKEGWLTYIPFILFLVTVPLIALANTDNAMLAMLIIFPNWVAAGMVMTYIGSQNS